MAPTRIILDTNIWISYLISNDLLKLDDLILNHKAHLLFSYELLGEFLDVATRPKFAKFFSTNDLLNLLLFLETNGSLIKVRSQLEICRDPKDNFLLALAIDGKADLLVTGDNDLLILKSIEKTRIISVNQFNSFSI